MCDSCKEERFKIEEKIRESNGQILQSQISTEQENLHGTVLPPNAVLKKYIIDSRLSCKKLKNASFEGKGITEGLPIIIQKINEKKKTLQILHVVDCDPDLKTEDIGELCNTVEEHKLSELHLEIEKLQNSIHKIQNVPLFLTVRAATYEDLDTFIKALSREEPCFMKDLTLIGAQGVHMQETSKTPHEKLIEANNIQTETPNSGECLAAFLFMFPKLQRLKLEQCGINKDTLNVVNETIRRKYGNNKSPLTEMNFISNDLSKAGNELGALISGCNLDILSICDSKLDGLMLEQLAAGLHVYAKLRKLHLENNPIGNEFCKVAQLLNKLPNLEVLEIIGCGINRQGIQELNDVLQDEDDEDEEDDGGNPAKEILKKVRILNLGYNDLSQGGLLELGHFILLFLPELQALCLPYCQCEDIDDLAKLVTRLPERVNYLDVSKNLYGGKITEITARENVKEKLCRLRRLNIGQRDNDSERVEIRTNLAQMHQDMEVEVYYAEQDMFPFGL